MRVYVYENECVGDQCVSEFVRECCARVRESECAFVSGSDK